MSTGLSPPNKLTLTSPVTNKLENASYVQFTSSVLKCTILQKFCPLFVEDNKSRVNTYRENKETSSDQYEITKTNIRSAKLCSTDLT